jgi:hypothetical protein
MACEPLVIVESCVFSPSGFLLRKDWLTTSTPKLDDVSIIQTKEEPILTDEQ